MANQATWAKQVGATPGKLALVGGLAVMLGGVLYLQFAPTKSRTSVAATPRRPTANSRPQATPAAPARTAASSGQRKKTGTLAPWQSVELASAVAFDPFALPAAFPDPREVDDEKLAAAATVTDASAQQAALQELRTKSEAELKTLRQQGVRVILNRKRQYVAMVGEQEVHVGDQIQGFTVIAIDASGVRVAKDLSP